MPAYRYRCLVVRGLRFRRTRALVRLLRLVLRALAIYPNLAQFSPI